ncbi:MAG: dTMP kinase [Candidatus Omnitrophota bacterium]
MKGIFITFEGAEGSGKSTQMELLVRYLRSKKKNVIQIREPGGVVISEKIRTILLDPGNRKMCKASETLLYMAARAQLVEEIILPSLKKGKIVLCDRFLDSTLAYQGYGCGVNLEAIRAIGRFATAQIKPDLTLVFDLSTQEGLRRVGANKDRIEQRSFDYHKRVRKGYLQLARKNPKRIKVIRVDGDKGKIEKVVRDHIDRLLK